MSNKIKCLNLSDRQLCDLELLLNGGFAPLTGFLNQNDYESVLENNRLCNNQVWPMPINLDVSAEFANKISLGEKIQLIDKEGVPLANITVKSIWQPDKKLEAEKVFGTTDTAHPAVNYLFNHSKDVYIGGKLEFLELPNHYDFSEIRRTPAECREFFNKNGWKNVVAFQTRNPMHRAHQALTEFAMKEHNLKLMIHPVVGMTKPGDVNHFTRVRCYQKLMGHYDKQDTILSLLPLAMRMGGPREALWHALIRKNYGCTHFIVGRDHAGPGKDSKGKDFYGAYDAQEMVKQYEDEIGIKMIPFQELLYVFERKTYLPVNEVKKDETVGKISGTQFRQSLRDGSDIPTWFSYHEIIQELRKTYPPKLKQGITLFFTGLSGSGKSTLANALMQKLMMFDDRKITILDGDHVRQHLSSELGFSKAHRDLNVVRIGYVASEITKHGGIAICAPIAPYTQTRNEVRELVSEFGNFIEIHVATPISKCEERDRKGLYAKARKGEIKGFTGIDDPYEDPLNPEIKIDTSEKSISDCVDEILAALAKLNLLKLQNKEMQVAE